MNIYFFFATWGQWVIAGSIVLAVCLRAARLHLPRRQARRAASIELREALLTLSWVGIVAVSARIVAGIFKLIFPVARPFVALGQVPPVSVHWYDSFPSGHALVLGAVATSVFLFDRRLGWWCTAIAILTALSRVQLGIHTYFDISLGYILGILVGYYTGKRLLRLKIVEYFIPKLK